MTPRSLIISTAASFRKAGIPDPENDAALLLSFLLGDPPLSLRLDMDRELQPAVLEAYEQLVRRRLSREPLQYIIGSVLFGGLSIRVDSRVLIPRPETAFLCEWALEVLRDRSDPRILDLCCGSGCIGLKLKSAIPSSCVLLADLSSDALQVSADNASRLNLSVDFHRGDLFDGLDKVSPFDLIISNPPYIPSRECPALQSELHWEPLTALDGGSDGLLFYRRIAEEAPDFLKPDGMLMLEIGDGELKAVSDLLLSAGFRNLQVRQDLNHLDRMILSRCPDRRAHV